MSTFFRAIKHFYATDSTRGRWIVVRKLISMQRSAPLLLVCLACNVATASPQTAPVTTPPMQSPPPKGGERSLDDILGIPEPERGGSRGADEVAGAKREGAVDRVLAGQPSLADLMQRALEEMKISQARLSTERDTGLGTQRAQEAALKALDALIASARQRQQQQQQSSSSSSSSQSKQKQKKDSSGDPSEGANQASGKQEGKGEGEGEGKGEGEQSGANKKPGGTDSSDATDKPTEFEQGDAGAELREAGIEWGRLPQRLREVILQGRRDHVSAPYERLTREYYKRLAEEASR